MSVSKIAWDEIENLKPKELSPSQANEVLIRISFALLRGELVLTEEQRKKYDFIRAELDERADGLVPEDD